MLSCSWRQVNAAFHSRQTLLIVSGPQGGNRGSGVSACPNPTMYRVILLILLQLREFNLGLLQDGDVGVGVFPERDEILIRGRGLGGVALHGVGAS